MTAHVVAALLLLIGPAVLPSFVLLGARPITFFVTPLVGAVLAAIAAEAEAAIGGTILSWFVVIAVAANVGALLRVRPRAAAAISQRRAGSEGADRVASIRPWWRTRPPAWSCVTVVVIACAVAWPLQALRSPLLGYDGFAIWTLHSLFMYGGHNVLHSALTNPDYSFSNPNYPPLVPASGALAFAADGGVDLRVAVIMTAILNASALGAVGCAIVATVDLHRGLLPRLTALVAGACVCLIGFGLSGAGGVDGYADLLWAASALAAVITGLLLPLSIRNLAAAWICATVAGLSKTEGFVTACMILLLLALRYVALPSERPGRAFGAANEAWRPAVVAWTRWLGKVAGLAIVMALPGLLWVGYVRAEGIGSDFVGSSTETLRLRLHATAPALWSNIHILPYAACVAVVAAAVLSGNRRRLSIGNDFWLWLVVGGSLLALLTTYVFGALEIHWWLSTSANRTTIFENLSVYGDLAIWLSIAVASANAANAANAEDPPAASLELHTGESQEKLVPATDGA